MQARGVAQVVDRSAVIGSRPWQGSVRVPQVLGVAVPAEIEGIELIECLTSVDAELSECLVEGPLRAGGGVGRRPSELSNDRIQADLSATPCHHGLEGWGPG